ncbi:hypothetical protein KP79_PYT12670 [Mizuhopecten yessoensis]|uniref:Uncharacterized protein n=1 Tax=Mizuhopecten yessoensis TaxID=6573 RepID=A0A210PLK1_MIZYE|nr:hypothetical protein KP79_PYT12670 [Mizuhopecten yessoensis]
MTVEFLLLFAKSALDCWCEVVTSGIIWYLRGLPGANQTLALFGRVCSVL